MLHIENLYNYDRLIQLDAISYDNVTKVTSVTPNIKKLQKTYEGAKLHL